MNTALGMKISKDVENLIKSRVTVSDRPYEFKLIGVSGHGYDIMTTAHIAFEKIKYWAEREGSKVNLITDKYSEILNVSLDEIRHLDLLFRVGRYKKASSKNQSKGYLLVEITDPCARIMESILSN